MRKLERVLRVRESAATTTVERSQRVTASDIAHGQIRFPRAAKRFFPSARADVDVVLRDERVSASYDPRTGPDRERSAVLRVGREKLARLVAAEETLRVTTGVGGVVRLD